jgi:hypothetical protein
MNYEWRMENGGWRMEDGRWKMGDFFGCKVKSSKAKVGLIYLEK